VVQWEKTVVVDDTQMEVEKIKIHAWMAGDDTSHNGT